MLGRITVATATAALCYIIITFIPYYKDRVGNPLVPTCVIYNIPNIFKIKFGLRLFYYRLIFIIVLLIFLALWIGWVSCRVHFHEYIWNSGRLHLAFVHDGLRSLLAGH